MTMTDTRGPGRPCSTCTSPERAEIERAWVSGVTVSAISGRYGVSPSSLYRHLRGHLLKELAASYRPETPLDVPDLLKRVLDVADSARDARIAASGTAGSLAASRARDSEIKALTLLTSRLGVDDESQIESAELLRSLASAVGAAVRREPSIGDALATELTRLGAHDSSAELTALATASRQELLLKGIAQ